MSYCPFCKKKIAMSKAFCSRSCKENYFQLISIQVPDSYVKRIYTSLTEKDRATDIESFANRFKWRLDLVKNKIEEKAIALEIITDPSKN
ncbi:MAG TPA: hypothetical protein EYG73_02490 [Arcobacter sp.]|nr:hypothetical protein [Arcobacter sp.]